MAGHDATRAPGTVVVPGVHRVAADHVNWYLVEADDGVTVVDAGLPGQWTLLVERLATLGATTGDVRALLVTHAHPDHMGFARRLGDAGASVHVHRRDEPTVRHGVRVDLPARFRRNLWRPQVLAKLIRWVRLGLRPWNNLTGGHVVPAVTDALCHDGGERLPCPGRPHAVHVPGHTPGSTAYVFPDHGVVCTGDALVTEDPVTGRRAIGACPRGLNADDEQAVASLRALGELDVPTVLPGHGEPRFDGLRRAAAEATDRGTRW
jgi:glyoxylase-like metal-dependent hydrolase (beta-lactamase superfamily II)